MTIKYLWKVILCLVSDILFSYLTVLRNLLNVFAESEISFIRGHCTCSFGGKFHTEICWLEKPLFFFPVLALIINPFMTNFYFVFVDPVTTNNPNFDGCECVSGNSSFYCCQPISVYRFSELGKKFQMHLLEISVKTKKQH